MECPEVYFYVGDLTPEQKREIENNLRRLFGWRPANLGINSVKYRTATYFSIPDFQVGYMTDDGSWYRWVGYTEVPLTVIEESIGGYD